MATNTTTEIGMPAEPTGSHATPSGGTAPRNQSLDALRGFAILAMVLSGSIAFGGVLPAWMYHAQVPPPTHKFDPSIPGITWVDLVFPFFLFSMGAAIPLSLAKLERDGASFWDVLWIAARRFALLAFFAFFTYHMRAWVMAEAPTPATYGLSVLAFALLCVQFYDHKSKTHKNLVVGMKVVAFAAAAVLLWRLPFHKGEGFRTDKVDIIILVLANMAFFGTMIWWLTRKNALLRVGLLAFVAAVFLGAKEAGSWNEWFYNLTPADWLYKFYFLKYLFLIIPGTVAGEWLRTSTGGGQRSEAGEVKAKHEGGMKLTMQRSVGVTLLAFGLVVCNTALLFGRLLVLNLVLTIALCLLLRWWLKRMAADQILLSRFWTAGTYLLLLGLAMDAYEGGIKKDPSTYSYYFVTGGLAFFMLIGFYALQGLRSGQGLVHYLALNGRNPMVAYVAGNLLLLPLLHLTGGIRVFEAMNGNAWIGFLRGVLFTGIVSLVTVWFTKRRWFWKT